MTLDFVVACIVKITVVFALAWIGSWALRRSSAALRHSVWAAAVMAALTLPVLMWTLPEWRAKSVTVKPVWQESQPVIVAGVPRAWNEMPGMSPALVARIDEPTPLRKPWTTEEIAAAVWAVGLLVGLMRLFIGLIRVRAIPATPLAMEAPRGVRVLQAQSNTIMPLTWGLFRPCVLFPANVSEWPEERVRQVLAHELAHIERRDWIVHIAAEIMRAVYWFHPLAWLAASQLRQESERACDDAVLSQGADACGYAEHLVHLARALKSPVGVVSSTLAAAYESKFEKRLAALLHGSLDRRPLSRKFFALNALIAAALLIPLATFAFGQEVRGKVVESGTNHGVPEAEVEVRRVAALSPGVTGAKSIAKLKTDFQGEFVYKTPDYGDYHITVWKEGYGSTASQGAPPNMFSMVSLSLNKDNPNRDVQFTLQRRGTLTGRIVDADTNEPISGFTVRLLGYSSTNGQTRPLWSGSPVTDPQGVFHAEVVPGPYLIEVRPLSWSQDRIVKTFTPEDAAKTDMDYRLRYFPGGQEIGNALPVHVASGAPVDIGTIRIRKEPAYRARVTVGGECPPGEIVTLHEVIAPQAGMIQEAREAGQVACGSEFLLRNLQPGSYALHAGLGKDSERGRANIRFTVGENNLSLALTVARGSTIEGRVIAAEGAGPLPFETFAVSAMPLEGTLSILSDMLPARIDASGRFHFENVLPWPRVIKSPSLSNQFYIKEVRYRGNVAPDGLFDFTGAGPLEVVIDSQPAAVTGTVRNQDKPVAGADVFLIRWPVPQERLAWDVRRITTDSEGYFQVLGLVPAEYRIFSVMPVDRAAAQEPAAWSRLLSRAEKLTLSRGASQSLTLRPSDPAR